MALVKRVQQIVHGLTNVKYALVCETVDDCSIKFIATRQSQRAEVFTIMNLLQDIHIRSSSDEPTSFQFHSPLIPVASAHAAELLKSFNSWQLWSVRR